MAIPGTTMSGFLRHLGPQRAVSKVDNPHRPTAEYQSPRPTEDPPLKPAVHYRNAGDLRDRIDILSDRANRIQERQLNRRLFMFLPWYPHNLLALELCHWPVWRRIFWDCRSQDEPNRFLGVGRSLLTNECWVGSGLSLVQMALVDGFVDCLRCIFGPSIRTGALLGKTIRAC